MAIFDEPSRQPLPQPTFEDVVHAGRKGLISIIPALGGLGSELVALLSSPVAERRDSWLQDLERRLRDLEGKIDGFHFDDLSRNEQFVSATLQATQAALRTHRIEKLDALRNAVLNVALGSALNEDLQLIFLSLVDSFTPMHLRVLGYFRKRDGHIVQELRKQQGLADQCVTDLASRGLLKDNRPYEARNREPYDGLLTQPWEISGLGKQFSEFIDSPRID